MAESSVGKEVSKGAVATTAGGAGALACAVGLKTAAAMALPTIMAKTGVVVAGVGTSHGAITATVASFAATPVGLPVVTIGALGGLAAYGIYSVWTRPGEGQIDPLDLNTCWLIFLLTNYSPLKLYTHNDTTTGVNWLIRCLTY